MQLNTLLPLMGKVEWVFTGLPAEFTVLTNSSIMAQDPYSAWEEVFPFQIKVDMPKEIIFNAVLKLTRREWIPKRVSIQERYPNYSMAVLSIQKSLQDWIGFIYKKNNKKVKRKATIEA